MNDRVQSFLDQLLTSPGDPWTIVSVTEHVHAEGFSVTEATEILARWFEIPRMQGLKMVRDAYEALDQKRTITLLQDECMDLRAEIVALRLALEQTNRDLSELRRVAVTRGVP